MKYKITFYIIISFILIFPARIFGKLLYDQKFITVGVLSNDALPQFTKNGNIRFMGKFSVEDLLSKGGQITLDKLFNLNHPSIEDLYRQGYYGATKEEYEKALKDISNDPKIILQSEGALQLIKNNYIVIIRKEWKQRKESGYIKMAVNETLHPDKTYWKVYKVVIDDEIVNQVFENWTNSYILKQIKVPISLVASGVTKRIENLVYDISRKVEGFAIRGPIISSDPCIAEMTSVQGVNQGDKVKIYQTKEAENGMLFSKKVGDGKVLRTGTKNTNIKVVSGRTPSNKEGDIACIVGRGDWSIFFEGDFSFGQDWRAGGRLYLDRRFYYTNKGVSWNVLIGLGVDQYNKEPDEIWYPKPAFNTRSVQPSLRTYYAFLGLSMGYSFLTKFEIIPYFTMGVGLDALTRKCYYWDSMSQSFEEPGVNLLLPFSLGVKLAYNILYPLQLLVGDNYNINLDMAKTLMQLDDISVEDFDVKPDGFRSHDFNRLNFNIGLRYNF